MLYACHKKGQQCSTEVTHDHGWQQVKACGYPVTPAPKALRGKLTDATGYPLPTPLLRQATTPRVPLTLVNHGQ